MLAPAIAPAPRAGLAWWQRQPWPGRGAGACAECAAGMSRAWRGRWDGDDCCDFPPSEPFCSEGDGRGRGGGRRSRPDTSQSMSGRLYPDLQQAPARLHFGPERPATRTLLLYNPPRPPTAGGRAVCARLRSMADESAGGSGRPLALAAEGFGLRLCAPPWGEPPAGAAPPLVMPLAGAAYAFEFGPLGSGAGSLWLRVALPWPRRDHCRGRSRKSSRPGVPSRRHVCLCIGGAGGRGPKASSIIPRA